MFSNMPRYNLKKWFFIVFCYVLWIFRKIFCNLKKLTLNLLFSLIFQLFFLLYIISLDGIDAIAFLDKPQSQVIEAGCKTKMGTYYSFNLVSRPDPRGRPSPSKYRKYTRILKLACNFPRQNDKWNANGARARHMNIKNI